MSIDTELVKSETLEPGLGLLCWVYDVENTIQKDFSRAGLCQPLSLDLLLM